MQRFFEIPELLDLTFHFVDQRDRYNLLRVSRSAFYSAAPLVWKSLGRISDLMVLIRGTRYTTVFPAQTRCI
ncbi:hypothetical protein FRC08_003167, partial [Ceratobasidium sp. 394]